MCTWCDVAMADSNGHQLDNQGCQVAVRQHAVVRLAEEAHGLGVGPLVAGSQAARVDSAIAVACGNHRVVREIALCLVNFGQ